MRNKLFSKNKGFSLIEVIMVIAIVAIIGSSFISISINFLTSNNLTNITDELVSALRTSQTNSIYGKGGSNWGVKISINKIIIYKGNSYETRDQSFDISFNIPSNITVTQNDIFFFRRTGTPSASPSITLQSQSGDARTVSINKEGTADLWNN